LVRITRAVLETRAVLPDTALGLGDPRNAHDGKASDEPKSQQEKCSGFRVLHAHTPFFPNNPANLPIHAADPYEKEARADSESGMESHPLTGCPEAFLN
jgi:hypothetical protein